MLRSHTLSFINHVRSRMFSFFDFSFLDILVPDDLIIISTSFTFQLCNGFLLGVLVLGGFHSADVFINRCQCSYRAYVVLRSVNPGGWGPRPPRFWTGGRGGSQGGSRGSVD